MKAALTVRWAVWTLRHRSSVFRLRISKLSDWWSTVAGTCAWRHPCVVHLPFLDECPVAPGRTRNRCQAVGDIYCHIPALLRLIINPAGFTVFYVHQLNVCFICPETLIRENEIMLIIWHQSNKQALAGSYRDLDTPTCTHAVGGYDYTWITAFIVRSFE